MRWLPPITIIIFGFLYWQINHLLRITRFSDKQESKTVLPRDRWMGLATAILLSPLILVYYFAGLSVISVFFSAILPIVVAILLGLWRGRYSVSSILIQSTHGAVIAFLSLTDRAASIQSCINLALTTNAEQRLQSLSYCAEMTRFWINIWITLSITLITVFGGAVISLYLIKPDDFGWKGSKEERQILAILYSISIIWILMSAFLWTGVPLLQHITTLADLQRLFRQG